MLVSCSHEYSPTCWYGWYGDEAVLLVDDGSGKNLAVVSIPATVVTGYQTYLATNGQEATLEQTLVTLCGIPAAGFFGGASADLIQLRGLLDSLAIETGVSMTNTPTATQRIQALVSYAKPLRKTAMVDTLGKLMGLETSVDGLLAKLEHVTACAGYDAGAFMTIDNTTDWERTRNWLELWLRQVLASVQRSK